MINERRVGIFGARASPNTPIASNPTTHSADDERGLRRADGARHAFSRRHLQTRSRETPARTSNVPTAKESAIPTRARMATPRACTTPDPRVQMYRTRRSPDSTALRAREQVAAMMFGRRSAEMSHEQRAVGALRDRRAHVVRVADTPTAAAVSRKMYAAGRSASASAAG